MSDTCFINIIIINNTHFSIYFLLFFFQRQGFAQVADGHEHGEHHVCVPGRVTPFQFQPAFGGLWRQSATSQANRSNNLVGVMSSFRNWKKPF